jgi:hypothetical protein
MGMTHLKKKMFRIFSILRLFVMIDNKRLPPYVEFNDRFFFLLKTRSFLYDIADGCTNIVDMTLIVQKTCHDSAVSRSHLTAETLLQSPASPSGECGGHIGIGTGYLRVVRFSPLSTIPPLPHAYLSPNTILIRRTSGRIPATFK